jgi:hypothetical protein
LRASKYVGRLAIGLAVLLIVGAAVLPVGVSAQRFGPFRIDVGGNTCGPAGYVAFHQTGTECGQAAATRLQVSTPIGLLVLALGMAMFVGGDEPNRSRVEVSSPRVRRRPGGRTRRGRRSVTG